jgi:hypothetical protein
VTGKINLELATRLLGVDLSAQGAKMPTNCRICSFGSNGHGLPEQRRPITGNMPPLGAGCCLLGMGDLQIGEITRKFCD